MTEFCADTFAERSAIIEFDGGFSRFDAETMAAGAQGLARWQVMKILGDMENAERGGNPQPARDQRPAMVGNGSGAVSGVFSASAKQNGSLPVGDVPAGWGSMDVSPLRGARR